MTKTNIEKATRWLALNKAREHNPLTHERIVSTPELNGGLRLEVLESKREYVCAFWVTLLAVIPSVKFGTQVRVRFNGTEKEMSHKFFGKLISINQARELESEIHQGGYINR